jgi:nucleoside-diphosphate kinase
MIERTLILLKPDAVQRGIVGEILSRFEKAGLKMVGVKMLSPGKEHYHKHYEDISKMITRRGQQAFDVTLNFMMSGPVVAVVLEGVNSVALVRKMVGETEPKAAQPGTIRGDYAHISFEYATEQGASVPNLIHASGDSDEAKQEIDLWFKEEELLSYKLAHENHILGK